MENSKHEVLSDEKNAKQERAVYEKPTISKITDFSVGDGPQSCIVCVGNIY